MADRPSEPRDVPEQDPEYEAPRARELPEPHPAATGPGATGTGGDGGLPSDRGAKRDFAEVDPDEALAAVRDLRVSQAGAGFRAA